MRLIFCNLGAWMFVNYVLLWKGSYIVVQRCQKQENGMNKECVSSPISSLPQTGHNLSACGFWVNLPISMSSQWESVLNLVRDFLTALSLTFPRYVRAEKSTDLKILIWTLNSRAVTSTPDTNPTAAASILYIAQIVPQHILRWTRSWTQNSNLTQEISTMHPGSSQVRLICCRAAFKMAWALKWTIDVDLLLWQVLSSKLTGLHWAIGSPLSTRRSIPNC